MVHWKIQRCFESFEIISRRSLRGSAAFGKKRKPAKSALLLVAGFFGNGPYSLVGTS